VNIIACIEDPTVIESTAWMQEVEQCMEQLQKILTHLNNQTASTKPAPLYGSRAHPQAVLFGALYEEKTQRGGTRRRCQGICRPESWNWPEHGDALPVFLRQGRRI
jgi:hypothetical protein